MIRFLTARDVSWLLTVYLASVICASIFMSVWLNMQPCILCYAGRFWIIAMLAMCCFLDLAKWSKSFFFIWLLSVLTNLYHLYLIYLAPPQTACVPWGLIDFKRGLLAKSAFALEFIGHNMSSCQSDNHIFLGLGLPIWLLGVQAAVLILFVLFLRKRHAL